jgi:NDP-sugar pyrophosphorylase family protein
VVQVAEKAEKPPSDLANVGAYVFLPDVFDWIDRTPPNPKRKEIEITDTLQSMIDAELPVRCHQVKEWYELGKPWDIIGLNEMLLRRTTGQRGAKTDLGPRVRVGEGTLIEATAKVIGPSIIGRDCRIKGRAIVGPYCSVGDGSVIDGAKVEGSVLMEACRVEEGATVGHSVLGPHSFVGGRATLADRDPHGRSIRLRIKDKWLD